MNLREFFRIKSVVRPESPKEVKTTVVTVEFPEWIDTLKTDYANATIRVKRTQKLHRESAYVGDPIDVSNIDAATFDRILFELFGGGNFNLEYWQGSRRIMMKNSKPQRAVTHTISVEGEPKQQGGRKTASESAALAAALQPKSVLGTLLKQLDTPEGILALTGLFTMAKDFFMSTRKDSGGFKDMVESMGLVFGMMPTPPDELEQLERYQKLSGIFAASNRPPVNIAGGSGGAWDTVAKVLGQVLGTAVANAQNNGRPKLVESPEGQIGLPQTGAVSEPITAGVPKTAPSPAESATPQAKFVSAKILSLQTGMQANVAPYDIANDLWSLLVFIIENGIVDEAFVKSLYADPDRSFDQIIALYAPQSASYPKLDEVKRVVVGYILEEGQEQQQTPDDFQAEAEKSVDANKVMDLPKREPETGSGEPTAEVVRSDPVVVGEETESIGGPIPEVIRMDESGEYAAVDAAEVEITVPAED